MRSQIRKSENGSLYLLCPSNKNKTPKYIWLAPLEGEENICPVKTLELYLKLTATCAEGKFLDTMFFVFVPKIKPTSYDTIARWIKNALLSIGSTDTAHSTRGLYSTKAFLSGVKLENILKQADWSTPNTFKKYYFKPTEEIITTSTLAIFQTTNTPIVKGTFGLEEQSRLFE
ncbi:hypothetical protein AYI68_g933 [Smittium mucronatum]|uniref:Tyr recombinase domain-containing protein n=1 Tax=Smittium mucronatum TaxID=133383 RepID=A0A1R0H732_9FUNG|nr:hypothetical protein AYI68_g933 [Smittium mucronatum]